MLKNRRQRIKYKKGEAMKPDIPENPAELRRRAEAHLSDRRTGRRSQAGENKSEADIKRLLHELEVHQIELEMQNAELQEARDRMEVLLEKYTDLYDFAPVGYLTLDHEGAIHETNLTISNLLGMARSILVNRRLSLFVSPADRPVFDTFLKQVFEGGARKECEVSLLVEGKRPVDVRMEAIAFESGRECRVAVADIAEHKRAEADRLIMNKLESTGILAAGLAHDFNNLLTVVLLDIELAQMRIPADGEPAQFLGEARKAALTASDLTRQLITFAKGGAPVRNPARLSGVIQESVHTALSSSNVRCEFSLAEDLWMAEVDVGQIGQVIHNLVLNAREAMPQGGVVFVRAENVVLSAQEQPSLPAGEYLRLSIADQGGGVAKDVLLKIYDPYFSTKEMGDQRGMGLGLTICHSVIQRHGGAMVVKSEMGVGTTFHIYLPAARSLSGEGQASVTAGVSRQGRVLVMDDEEAVRKVVGLALWGMGHQVELVEEGQKAVEEYKKAASHGRHFDAVILDLTVRGGMGGQEAIRALLKIDPNVKAIAMSGYARDPVILEPDRHGFKGILAKPFEIGKLQEILSRVMSSSPGSKATT